MQFENLMQSAIGKISPLFAMLMLVEIVTPAVLMAQDAKLAVEKPPPILADPDGTGTIVTPEGDRFDIGGGQRSEDGGNLFHSFTRFGLDSSQTANFLADPVTRNIITRIVGGDISVIDGLLQVTGGQANLFFVNPAGIVFGANAALNVPGSFTATTANGLGFGDYWFNASGPNNYPVLVGPPDQFAFTMSQPGGIINAGNLSVNPGQSLNLIAGTVLSFGELNAPEGQVTVAAVSGESTVRLQPPGSLLSLEIQPFARDATQPNAWSAPITELPDLLTGGLGKSATDVAINEDGQIVLLGSGLTVEPGDVVVQNLAAQQATLAASQKVAIANVTLPTPEGTTLQDSLGESLTTEAHGNAYLVATASGKGFYIQGNIEIIFELDPEPISNLPPSRELPPLPEPDLGALPEIEQPLAPPPLPDAGVTPSWTYSPTEGGSTPGDVIAPPPQPRPMATEAVDQPRPSLEGPPKPEIAMAPPPQPEVIKEPQKPAIRPEPQPIPKNPPPTESTSTGSEPTIQQTSEPQPVAASSSSEAVAAEVTQEQPQPLVPKVRGDQVAKRNRDAIGETPGAVAIATKLQNCLQAGQVVESQGSTYYLMTDQSRVIQCYQQELAIAQRQQDSVQASYILHNLGGTYFVVGNYGQSILQYQQSLALAQRLQNRMAEAQALSGLGAAYSALGNYQQAIHYYERSLAISKTLDAPELQGVTLRNLGIAYLAQQDTAKAIAYPQESLAIARQAGDQRGIGQSLGNLGLTYFFKGDYRQAIDYLEQQMAIVQQLKDRLAEGRALGNLGLAYFGLKNFQQAVEYQQQSLAIARALQDRPTEGHALNNLGEALLRLGQLSEAEATLLSGIQLWESLRAQLGTNDSNKVSLFDTQATTYALLQETLVAQRKATLALEVAERGRARAFVELLARHLPGPGTKGLTAPDLLKPLTLAQIQAIARQQNATLVEYSVLQDAFDVNGSRQVKDSALYIWVVSPNGAVDFRQVDLKPLWQAENTSLDELVASTRTSIGVAGRGLVFNQKTEAIADALVRLQEQQSKSSQLKRLHQLLIQPIADLLPTDPEARVVFIPQGSLFLAPFPALQDARGDYLIEKHTLLTAPAIQVLALTHQQRQQQVAAQRLAGVQVASAQPLGAQPNSLIVGNPTMPHLPGAANERSQPLQSLPGAEREAKLIAELLKTQAVTGGQATKAMIVPRMVQAQIIHLATHGLLDDFRGVGIPGAIALAPSGQDDGLLTASEILDLKLNAELVVLSACDTGRGRITGDGVIGLSRSLISAGVPSVVVSLWQVPDAPTATLMTEFYQNLQRYPDKAQALRRAMLSTMRQHPDPKDWAAFTLIGEAE